MFYCDACAKDKKYPITADNKLRSFGNCELCGKTVSCNDFKGDVLDLGNVSISVFC